MQQCQRCGSGVPDGRATCQICSAPMAPAQPEGGQQPERLPLAKPPADRDEPQPGIPGLRPPTDPQLAPTGEGEVRRTLAGDVVEVPPPSPRAAGPLAGQRPGVPGPAAPRPGGPMRPASTLRPLGPSEEAEERPRRSAAQIALTVVTVLLVLSAAGGGAGFWFYQTRVAPGVPVAAFMEAFKQKQWKQAYQQIELPAAQKAAVTEETFATGMNTLGSLVTLQSYKVNDIKVDGETARVNVTMVASGALLGGQTKTDTRDITVKRFDGVWKIDATSGGVPLGAP